MEFHETTSHFSLFSSSVTSESDQLLLIQSSSSTTMLDLKSSSSDMFQPDKSDENMETISASEDDLFQDLHAFLTTQFTSHSEEMLDFSSENNPDDVQKNILFEIGGLFHRLHSQIVAGEAPKLEINGRALDANSQKTKMKFACFLRVLQIIHQLLKSKIYATKRDIFYRYFPSFIRDVDLFGNQAKVDKIIDELSKHFNCSRFDMNVLSSTKGLVFGSCLVSFTNGKTTSLNSDTFQGSLIPQMELVKDICFTEEPRFMLLVEKAAVFTHLLSVDLRSALGNVLIVTGKGFPDFQTRHFLSFINEKYPNLPMYALMDGDPYGIHIYLSYRLGSMKSPHNLPDLTYLGFLQQDVFTFSVPEEALLPLTEADRTRGMSLLGSQELEEYPEIKKELQNMLFRGYKAEIQSLIMYDQAFLKHNYLPSKLPKFTLFDMHKFQNDAN